VKRSGPPARKTPLAQGDKPLKTTKPLERGKPLQARQEPVRRSAPPARAAAPQRAAQPRQQALRDTGPSTATRNLVWLRDMGLCQRCGWPGTNLQHREGRGMGGRSKAEADRTNGPAWLVLVCGMGNASGCHKALDDDREAAERDGFVIRRNGPTVDATAVPVRTHWGWRLLTNDGRSIPCDAPV
jgi:hypothetical protein